VKFFDRNKSSRTLRSIKFGRTSTGLVQGVYMGCVEVVFVSYLWSLYHDAMLWVYKALSLREVLYNLLIDGTSFSVVFVIPIAAVMAELVMQCIPTTWRHVIKQLRKLHDIVKCSFLFSLVQEL